MSHFIEKCKECGTTISQCRCPSENKVVRHGTCKECTKKPTKTDNRNLCSPPDACCPCAVIKPLTREDFVAAHEAVDRQDLNNSQAEVTTVPGIQRGNETL